jgi:hypothetical protein
MKLSWFCKHCQTGGTIKVPPTPVPRPLGYLYALVINSHREVGQETKKLIGGEPWVLLVGDPGADTFTMTTTEVFLRMRPVADEGRQDFLVLHIQ